MTLAAIQWAWRADGLIHLIQDGHDLPRGPLGLLLYVPFALLFWTVPLRWRMPYLTLSSYLLLLVTLGPGYALALLLLALLGFAAVKAFGRPGRAALGTVLWSIAYTAFIFFPQPPFLPPVRTPTLREPLYFYLHWAGIGYVFLKTVHVLVDVSQRKMAVPPLGEFLAYLFFAPTVRMGPIYRFPEFAEQLRTLPPLTRGDRGGSLPPLARGDRGGSEPLQSAPLVKGGLSSLAKGGLAVPAKVDFGAAAIRIAFGLVRLGIMSAMLKNFPIERLFNTPETLPLYRFLGCIYAAPLSIYLWISGYVDISIGVGLLMGFRVPENFNYPWRATSLAEFWRRWHLTLGSWLRDYLYIPLGGNRRHVFLNYFVTFLFCGVWHGLYWSYALWGISQGVGLAVNRTWGLYWKGQRDGNSEFYQRLSRWRLVRSSANVFACWLLTFHYQILTIAWFMDEEHSGQRFFKRLADLILAK